MSQEQEPKFHPYRRIATVTELAVLGFELVIWGNQRGELTTFGCGMGVFGLAVFLAWLSHISAPGHWGRSE